MEGPMTLPRSRRSTFARPRRARSPPAASPATAPTALRAARLGGEPGRHVRLGGDRVTLPARATFYDGTGVPGVRLTTNLFGEQTITTDRTGVATATARATTDSSYVSVRPPQAEESEITASMSLNVFPASVRLTARARSRRVA